VLGFRYQPSAYRLSGHQAAPAFRQAPVGEAFAAIDFGASRIPVVERVTDAVLDESSPNKAGLARILAWTIGWA
jgi:hypothetical protein